MCVYMCVCERERAEPILLNNFHQWCYSATSPAVPVCEWAKCFFNNGDITRKRKKPPNNLRGKYPLLAFHRHYSSTWCWITLQVNACPLHLLFFIVEVRCIYGVFKVFEKRCVTLKNECVQEKQTSFKEKSLVNQNKNQLWCFLVKNAKY